MTTTEDILLERTNTRAPTSWAPFRLENTLRDEILARIDYLVLLDLEVPVGATSWDRARRLAWEIGDFISSHPVLPRPDIFASGGEISFEWQPHRTGTRLQALAVLSVDASRVDLLLARLDGGAVLLEDTREPAAGIRTFLLKLCDEISPGPR